MGDDYVLDLFNTLSDGELGIFVNGSGNEDAILTFVTVSSTSMSLKC